LPEVVEKSNEAKMLIQTGLDRVSQTVHLDGADIAVFNVDSSDVLINRYAPYYFFPKARYSLGIVRNIDGTKITAMRNPWLQFPSVYLGKIFERFGGGGHRRVGSLLLRGDDADNPERIMKRLLNEIRKNEPGNKKNVAA
jgi:nanoRNase/pAp phosphatase (c-di-AMP/oligoRNAs hydrolase)